MVAAIRVILPTGDLGLSFREKGTLPVISKISNDSPIADRVKLGQAITGVSIPEQVQAFGVDSKELVRILKESDEVAGRAVFVRELGAIVDVSRTARVTLPTGSIGVTFKQNTGQQYSLPVVSKIDDDSPIANAVHIGQFVTNVIIPGKIEISCMSVSDLVETLNTHSDVAGRILVVKDRLPMAPTSNKITLDSARGSEQSPSASTSKGDDCCSNDSCTDSVKCCCECFCLILECLPSS